MISRPAPLLLGCWVRIIEAGEAITVWSMKRQ
jgi:hypothetical protein